MKIIAIKQPWAALIVSDQKDVENRVWATRCRGPLIIRASQRPDDIMAGEIAQRFGVDIGRDLPLGGIIGIVELVDVVHNHRSKWYVPGHYAFVLTRSATSASQATGDDWERILLEQPDDIPFE